MQHLVGRREHIAAHDTERAFAFCTISLPLLFSQMVYVPGDLRFDPQRLRGFLGLPGV